MRIRHIGAAVLVPILMGAERVSDERVISGRGLVNVSVNGKAAVLRVDPAAPATPLINIELARSAGLKLDAKIAGRVGYLVGKTIVTARTQVVQVDLGNGVARRRVGWSERPFAMVADGSVGPEAFPEPVVRFQLRGPTAGEKTFSLPMERDAILLGIGSQFSPTFGRIEVGGEPMRVRFDPHHARSLVTAGGGARLARLNDGVIYGGSVMTEIFFGVQRPVRTLTLRRPFQLGMLAIPVLGIRTADEGSAAGIREAEATDSSGDPDEIIVIAKGKKRNLRRDTISLGADYLSRCSSIVFDRRAKLIRLTCG